MFDFKQYQALSKKKDWIAVHALLDDWRADTDTQDELLSEIYFRVGTFEDQGLHSQALDLLKEKGHLYKSKSYLTHSTARVLTKLGRAQDALDIMSGSPYEMEMTSFPIWAMDAKFFHVVLLTEAGDP